MSRFSLLGCKWIATDPTMRAPATKTISLHSKGIGRGTEVKDIMLTINTSEWTPDSDLDQLPGRTRQVLAVWVPERTIMKETFLCIKCPWKWDVFHSTLSVGSSTTAGSWDTMWSLTEILTSTWGTDTGTVSRRETTVWRRSWTTSYGGSCQTGQRSARRRLRRPHLGKHHRHFFPLVLPDFREIFSLENVCSQHFRCRLCDVAWSPDQATDHALRDTRGLAAGGHQV